MCEHNRRVGNVCLACFQDVVEAPAEPVDDPVTLVPLTARQRDYLRYEARTMAAHGVDAATRAVAAQVLQLLERVTVDA